ncbi:MAG: hypothetical protein GY765_18845 [bacterium]|nr:hypothetical protein [bacterium]
MNPIWFVLALLAVVFTVVIFLHVASENKKKAALKKKFRKFSSNYKMSRKDLRLVPRISIPDLMEVVLTLTDNDYFGLKAHALDISLSGFSVKPDFPLKKLPIEAHIKNVLVQTPINSFVIKEMKAVRIEHQVQKRLMAFHIADVDADQMELLQTFMAYLEGFLEKGETYD